MLNIFREARRRVSDSSPSSRLSDWSATNLQAKGNRMQIEDSGGKEMSQKMESKESKTSTMQENKTVTGVSATNI